MQSFGIGIGAAPIAVKCLVTCNVGNDFVLFAGWDSFVRDPRTALDNTDALVDSRFTG
jgi:hypothetical protein